ncbi:TPA: cell division protein ZapA [Candidatus Poribacteria bacterium]|nr:cell division protein ZapA [Candidatus Poribacteria bacterium]HEX29366.1 cell division protein ZapA [Candidatus Poribacteria bacterium]
MDKKSIKVEIYGAQYTLRASDEDEMKVRKVAQLVDRIMKEIKSRTGYDSPANLAILAALNIADQLYDSQEQFEKIARRLIDNLDRVLTTTS